MKKDLKELLMSVDVMNTLHGGVSEPFLSLNESNTEREVKVRVPGIDASALKAELHENQLSIYYMIPVNSLGTIVNMPKVVYNMALPHFVDLQAIHAEYEERNLIIHIPFNQALNGFHKKITAD